MKFDLDELEEKLSAQELASLIARHVFNAEVRDPQDGFVDLQNLLSMVSSQLFELGQQESLLVSTTTEIRNMRELGRDLSDQADAASVAAQ